VLALRPARPGEGLFREPERPRVFREAPVSELVPLAGGRFFLIPDVPASAGWTAAIHDEGIRVEPAEFALLSGGHGVLDVRVE